MRTKIKIPEIYYNGMSEAIDAAKAYATSKGYIVADEIEDMIVWESMSIGEYQTRLFTLYKNNIQCKKALNISLYKMDSGRYELTTYIN